MRPNADLGSTEGVAHVVGNDMVTAARVAEVSPILSGRIREWDGMKDGAGSGDGLPAEECLGSLAI